MSSRERAEFGHKVRVRQKANVEDQIGVFGHSMFEAETDARHQNVFARLGLVKALSDVGSEFMDIEPGGIEDQVRDSADGTKVPSFGRQRGFYGGVGTERVREVAS